MSSDKSMLEKQLAHWEERAGTLEKENAGLRQDLQGKTDMVDACTAAKETAQTLANGRRAELEQKTADLVAAKTLQKRTQDGYHSVSQSEQSFRSKYMDENGLRQATLNQFKEEQNKCKEKEYEFERLRVLISSKDEELKQLEYQLKDRDEELESETKTVAQLRDNLASTEQDFELVISLSTRAAVVRV